jgi:hypothetical protein
MKAIVFTTGTPDCEKLWRSFIMSFPTAEIKVMQYDVHGFDLGGIAEAEKPDVAIYIGAMAEFHNGCPVPSTEVLCRANRATRMIHLCSDSADPPWWPLLEEYNSAGAFRIQVGIDGCHDSPIAKFGRIGLTPLHPDLFPDIGWTERPHVCGFAGGGGFRQQMLDYFKSKGLVWFNEGGYVAYDNVCTFYTTCQMVLNDARTGSSMRRHIKGRFVEAALAGAVPIESHDSPAKDWFIPGVDYHQYSGNYDIEERFNRAGPDRHNNEQMAIRLRTKMRNEHSAPVFWNKVLADIGL